MPGTWSAQERDRDIDRAAENMYDLVIVGGGITGAGIARECALRGISFCLLDKNDFAYGTSSRSSKLFHGGMRYLASAEFGLVRESTVERNWLRSHLPHLVRPLGFVYPAYERGKARPFKVRLGVLLYDILSDWFSEYRNYRRSRIFRPSFIEEFEPAVTVDDPKLGRMLLAGFYYDTNCDDARVTLETIKESLEYATEKENHSTALNYCRVDSYEQDTGNGVRGVQVRDTLSGRSFMIRGYCVVSAAGVWTDRVLEHTGYGKERIYPTKGVHIVVPGERIGNRNAFSLASLDDGRFFFILRRGPVSVIGTTDTAYYPESRDLDRPLCRKEDCDYLLRTVNHMFPRAMLSYKDIIGTFAGIRPLIRQEEARHESDVSRRHEIFQAAGGMVAIAGGKSTIFRRMAEDLIFYLAENGLLKGLSRKNLDRRGFSRQPYRVAITCREFYHQAGEEGLLQAAHPDQVAHFHTQYGQGGLNILKDIRDNPSSGTPLVEGAPHCRAEINYILRREYAPCLEDILCRRTEAQWMVRHQLQPDLAGAVASIMADYYGWPEEKKTSEIKAYLDYVTDTVSFLREG